LFPAQCFEIYLDGITTKSEYTKEIIPFIVTTPFAKHDSRKGKEAMKKKSRGTKIMEEERRRMKEERNK
jgi:hypothetical protein